MKIENIDLVEYIPEEELPTECSYHPIFNAAITHPDRKDFWTDLNVSWIIAGFQWWRWN